MTLAEFNSQRESLGIKGNGIKSKLKREMSFGKGKYIIPQGESVELYFSSNRLDRIFIQYQDNIFNSLTVNGYKNYTGINKPPTINTLEKWSANCNCKTPTGYKIEPDGFGPDNSPSWLLVFGVI